MYALHKYFFNSSLKSVTPLMDPSMGHILYHLCCCVFPFLSSYTELFESVLRDVKVATDTMVCAVSLHSTLHYISAIFCIVHPIICSSS